MSNQMLIYGKPVPLSKEKHAGTWIEVGNDFGYTKSLNALPVLAAEFIVASREFPIVFAQAKEQYQPMVLLSMRGEQNFFLDEQNRWTGRYQPAFLRRYPFVFSPTEDAKNFILCVDETYKGLNKEGKGQPLFADDGKPSPYVNSILEFLRHFQVEQAKTQALCQKLDELDLLESQNAVWTSPEGEKVTLAGFACVNREKLKAVPPKMLAKMIETGEMDLIYAHLHSLHNLNSFKNKMIETA